VKNLQNNKASGYDNIVDEHIKHTIHMMMPIYCKLFYLILNTGKIPNSWSESIILISAFCSLTHRAALEIESNALAKSTKVQYNFFPRDW
jgi:hypothetical protein